MTTKQFQIFKEFTERMKTELEINSHKGDGVPWNNHDEIWQELDYHVQKLLNGVAKLNIKPYSEDNDNIKFVRKQSTSLANIALFIYNSTLPLEERKPSISLNDICPNCDGTGNDLEKSWLDCPICCGDGLKPKNLR